MAFAAAVLPCTKSHGLLHLKTEVGRGETPSKAWLKNTVVGARLDDDLWLLLQSPEWRNRLRDFILSHKFQR
ncbi:MAG: hypothetical protein IKM99_05265 [Bacteroidales bacterium]|nr:hypothetical protein [Bacteroidales bacterium]